MKRRVLDDIGAWLRFKPGALPRRHPSVFAVRALGLGREAVRGKQAEHRTHLVAPFGAGLHRNGRLPVSRHAGLKLV